MICQSAIGTGDTHPDITELRQPHGELQANEEQYRAIFDTAASAMVIFGDDLVIRLANVGWTKLTGYSKEETEGKLTWMPFFTLETLTRVKRYHEMRGKDPDSVSKLYEAQMVDRYGNIHDGTININLIPGTKQRVASFQDMTELKRAQNEIHRADKMASLGQIIAGVAHEINNPNNFIYFNLPILKKYIDSIRPLLDERAEQDRTLHFLNMPYDIFIEDIYKLLENMQHGSTRITDIVSDLKNYVRSSETEDKKPERIDAVVKQMMTMVGKQVRKQVKQFDIQVDESLPLVSMNTGKIEQVLINLVINAGQAADKDDSWVRLTTSECLDDAKLVEILVEDNGRGIPKKNFHSIFEPFFTTKAEQAGTGMGLAVSYQIIEDHGGTIKVTSKVGKGTKFTIRLPAN